MSETNKPIVGLKSSGGYKLLTNILTAHGGFGGITSDGFD
jgi:hypothetical protein